MTNSWPQRLIRPAVRFALRHWVRHEETIRIRQQLRYLALAQLLARSEPRPIDLTLFELSLYSQNGEDGVLAEILNRIGVQRGFFVEVGASTNEANCLGLADVFGWNGLFLEAGNDEYEGLARKYAGISRVRVVQELVTAANFNIASLESRGVPSDFHVLSIDVDGNDYWLWKALDDWKPQVVVIEYNSGLDPSKEVVQPYEPHRPWDGSSFYGASLAALCGLAHDKGYQLVHVELTGTNAFFVRRDVAGQGFVPESQVAARGANHFLYGLRYDAQKTADGYLPTEQ